jgi:hypothetical protein
MHASVVSLHNTHANEFKSRNVLKKPPPYATNSPKQRLPALIQECQTGRCIARGIALSSPDIGNSGVVASLISRIFLSKLLLTG